MFIHCMQRVLNLQINYDALVCSASISAWTLISTLSHALELGLDIDPANWAVLACHKPLVNAIAVEKMHAWQSPIKSKILVSSRNKC